MRKTLGWAALTAAVVAIPAAGGVAPNTFDEVAEFGLRAPGTPSGVTYSAIQMPITDGTGTFLYESDLDGGNLGSGFEDSGVFVGKRGAVQLVARTGVVAPGTGGLQWSKLAGVGQILRPSGKIAFPGELSGAGPTAKGGIWAGSAGNLQLVAREGDSAPGTTLNFASGNRYFQAGLHLAMNDAGAVALRAQIAGAGVTTANDTALFAGMPGALALFARLGAAAPDAGGATFVKDGSSPPEAFTAPSINASGQILFRGHLTGAGVTGTNADAIWFGDPAAPTIAARGGQTVTGAGIAPNSYLLGLGAEAPVLNDAGQILFESPYYDGTNLFQCVWLGPPHAPVVIAKRGQSVPGDSKGASIGSLFMHLRLNGNGQAAFHSMLSTGATDWALLFWDGSALREIWRGGDQAPGMPAGELFDNTATGTPAGDIFLNASGKVLFHATTTPSFIQGVWLWDPAAAGPPQLLARTGVNANIGSTSRLLIDLNFFNTPDATGSTQDGRSSPLGDDGTYAFLGETADDHLIVMTNAGGAGPTNPTAAATPTTLSVGTMIDVTGSGFGGGAKKFHAPKAWLTVGSDPKKIPLKVDATDASDTEIHATLVSMRKGAHGPATLHLLPNVKHATEATIPVTIELPSLTSLSATDLHGGDTLTLTGAYFGTKKRFVEFRATVNGKLKTWKLAAKTWADGSITAVVPKHVVPKGQSSLAGEVLVTNDAGDSETIAFTVDA
jgi:hypothetical protein